jgi:hypothetical protein
VVERTHAWFAGFGKLRIRCEQRFDIHGALLPWPLPLSVHASWTTCVRHSKWCAGRIPAGSNSPKLRRMARGLAPFETEKAAMIV